MCGRWLDGSFQRDSGPITVYLSGYARASSTPEHGERSGFARFEPEITVKVGKRKLRVYEVGISYTGRTYEEGKKIGLKDAFRALWCLLQYSVTEPAHGRPSPKI
jgi:hypothetical protein